MQFRAKVRRNSWAHKDWLGRSRVGGVISGVKFKRDGQDYVAVEDPLSEKSIAALLNNNQVDLEITSMALGLGVPEPPYIAPPKTETRTETVKVAVKSDELAEALGGFLGAESISQLHPAISTEHVEKDDVSDIKDVASDVVEIAQPKRRGRPPKVR